MSLSNQRLILQSRRHSRHRLARRTEHLGKSFLCQFDRVRSGTVRADQEPAAQAFPKAVEVVADSCLTNLGRVAVAKRTYQRIEAAVSFAFLDQDGAAHLVRLAWERRGRPVRRDPVRKQRCGDNTGGVDRGELNQCSVGCHAMKREHAAHWEVRVADLIADIRDDCPACQQDTFAERRESTSIRLRQCGKQTVRAGKQGERTVGGMAK